MVLGDIAHVRTGDKGDICQLAVICFDPADYPRLAQMVTVQRVVEHLALLQVRSARRYDLPGLGALNFVLDGALSGGVTRSLALDAHGKSIGAQILDLPIDPPAADPVP